MNDRVSVRLSKAVRERVAAVAAEHHCTQSDAVRALIERGLAADGGPSADHGDAVLTGQRLLLVGVQAVQRYLAAEGERVGWAPEAVAGLEHRVRERLAVEV